MCFLEFKGFIVSILQLLFKKIPAGYSSKHDDTDELSRIIQIVNFKRTEPIKFKFQRDHILYTFLNLPILFYQKNFQNFQMKKCQLSANGINSQQT